MGSMNYAKWNSEEEFAFNFVFANSFDDIVAFARAMNEHGIKPEMECFDTGHTNSHRVLADLGLIERRFTSRSSWACSAASRRRARHLAFQAEQVPAGSRWKVIGISRDQWPLAMAALSLGGDVRVGLEDNFYLPDGAMAKTTASSSPPRSELVKLVGALGRERRRDASAAVADGGGKLASRRLRAGALSLAPAARGRADSSRAASSASS